MLSEYTFFPKVDSQLLNYYNVQDKSVYVEDLKGWLVPSEIVKGLNNRYNKIEKKFEELCNNFDFIKVNSIMKLLNWTYFSEKESPSIDTLKKVVRQLFDSIIVRVLEDKYCFATTGGFKLEFNPDEDGELKLTFEAVTDSEFLENGN